MYIVRELPQSRLQQLLSFPLNTQRLGEFATTMALQTPTSATSQTSSDRMSIPALLAPDPVIHPVSNNTGSLSENTSGQQSLEVDHTSSMSSWSSTDIQCHLADQQTVAMACLSTTSRLAEAYSLPSPARLALPWKPTSENSTYTSIAPGNKCPTAIAALSPVLTRYRGVQCVPMIHSCGEQALHSANCEVNCC